MRQALTTEEGFFRRWARLKSHGGAPVPEAMPSPMPAPVPDTRAAPAQAEADAPPAPLPTLEDVARLTPDADFSAFVAKGVEKAVRRLALKKLFADPHFNAIDGLDMYMNDYNKASPLSPDMLASLKHAPGVLSRLLGEGQEDQQAAAAQAQPQEQPPEQPPEQSPHQAPPSTHQGNA